MHQIPFLFPFRPIITINITAIVTVFSMHPESLCDRFKIICSDSCCEKVFWLFTECCIKWQSLQHPMNISKYRLLYDVLDSKIRTLLIWTDEDLKGDFQFRKIKLYKYFITNLWWYFFLWAAVSKGKKNTYFVWRK